MAKTREYQCIHYLNEGNCDLGRKGEFYGSCQTCSAYKRKPHSRPNRKDTRRERLERISRKEKGNGYE